jgi:hypothetical protein
MAFFIVTAMENLKSYKSIFYRKCRKSLCIDWKHVSRVRVTPEQLLQAS